MRKRFKTGNHIHGHVSSGREIMSTAVLMPHIVIIKYGKRFAFHHFPSSLTASSGNTVPTWQHVKCLICLALHLLFMVIGKTKINKGS